jgi:hypothetical protein
MAEKDRPITPEMALLAVKAAGLSPDKSLTQQLSGDGGADLEQQVADLSQQVKTLSEALSGQGNVDQPTEPQPHEQLAKRLHEAQSPWFSYGQTVDGDAAA